MLIYYNYCTFFYNLKHAFCAFESSGLSANSEHKFLKICFEIQCVNGYFRFRNIFIRLSS